MAAIIIFVLSFNLSYSQTSSRNGYWLPNSGTLRILLVFAEVTDYAWDTDPSAAWPAHEMPVEPGKYFDHEFTGAEDIQGFMTEYFYQASFGNFIVLGDYVDELFQIDEATLSGNGEAQVLDWLNAMPGTDIETANGYSFNNNFDFVTKPATPVRGVPKTVVPDDYIDMILILWRTNSNISTTDNSGSVSLSPLATTVKGISGFMDHSRFISYNNNAESIMRHEFSHSLYGGNDYHNAGPNHGNRTFISAMGGYSNMGGFDKVYEGFNAWDRNRMGWKPETATNYIRALCPTTLTEVNSDLVYNTSFPCTGGEFILRDFVTTGDALRIKLPNLKADNPDIRDQWIWIENHQFVNTEFENEYENSAPSVKGIYAYVQVDKEPLTTFSLGPNNYTKPLNAYGNYDIGVEFATNTMLIDPDLPNPFTGYHFWMQPAFDLNGDDEITSELYTDLDGNGSFNSEIVFIHAVKVDGVALPSSDFRNETNPSYGTRYDGFEEGDKISMSSNPSTASVYTYFTSEDIVNSTPATDDNRFIRLNGLSIEVVDQLLDGSIKVRIKYDDFTINNNVRWCGDIMLHEDLQGINTAEIKLDRGLMPTRLNDPVMFSGNKVFTDTTILTLRSGSGTQLDNTSNILQLNKSAIVVKGGADLTLNDGAFITMMDRSWTIAEASSNITLNENSYIIVDDTSTLHIKADANVILKNDTYILVKNQGRLIIEAGNNLELQNNAKIIVDNGGYFIFNGNDLFLNGTNTKIELKAGGTIKTAANVDFTFTGTGHLYYFKDGIFTFGVNSKFVLHGSGTTDRKMWVGINALLYIPGHDVDISDCRIDYLSGATFKVATNNTTFDNVFVNDGAGTAGHAIYAYNTEDLLVHDCDFDGFNSTILLEDIDVCPFGDDINVNIEYSTFVHHDFSAIEAYDVERIRFFTSTAQGATSVVAGLFLEDVDECLVDNSTVKDYLLNSVDAAGIFAHRVGALIIDGSSIRNNYEGIEARATNIYVRNSAVIKNNTNGIYSISSEDGTSNPEMMYRLTVGDEGCGWIINNTKGVIGEDILLDIDQMIHALVSENPFLIYPNRFDGNSTSCFEVCYDFYDSDDITSDIPAKHNYWTSGVAPTNYVIGDNAGCNNINLDAADYYTSQPTSCDCVYEDCEEEPTEESIELRLSDESCTYLINKNGGGRITIGNQYRDAYMLFTAGSYNYAYQKFNWLKNRVEAEYSGGLPDGVCKHQYISSIGLKKISEILATVHCQYPFWIEDREAMLFEPNYSKFLLFPNPTQTIITLGSLEGLTANYEIRTLTGEVVKTGYLEGSVTIDVSSYSKGIYLIVFKDENSIIIETQKMIVQ